MNISEIMDRIHEVEGRVPVHEWHYRNLDLWPVLRSKLYFDLFFKHNFPVIGNASSFPSKVFDFAKKITFNSPDFFKAIYYFLTSQKFDVVFLADLSYTKQDGKNYQRFVDPEIEWLSKNGKSATTMIAMPIANNSLTNPTFNIFIPDLAIRLISALYKHTTRNTVNLSEFEAYNDHIEKLGLQRISSQYLFALAIKYWLMSEFYQIILKKMSPRAVFVVSYYESLNMAFVHAAKMLNIPVVDIQHGSINNFHACYGGWSNMPENGYNTLPDYFSCWDTHSAECINQWAKYTNGKHQAVVHGNRFMQKVLAQKNYFESSFKAIQSQNLPDFNILLTLQTCYELTPFLENMLRMSPENYFWWIRFHPMLSEQAINGIKQSLSSFKKLQCNTDDATSHSLYAILPLMDSHVTLNSSVVIEASQMGIPSIICEETGYNYYQEAFESGDAFKALTPKEAIRLIATIAKNTKKMQFPIAESLYRMLNVI